MDLSLEGTARFEAEMVTNELARETISNFSFCLFWCCPVGEGITIVCDGEYRSHVAQTFRPVGKVYVTYKT